MAGSQKLARLWRALISLEGLTMGDTFGSIFFSFSPTDYHDYFETRMLPEARVGSWNYTDDTLMALSLIEILRRFHAIDQDQLIASFATHYDPGRGYGSGMHALLHTLRANNDVSQLNAPDENLDAERATDTLLSVEGEPDTDTLLSAEEERDTDALLNTSTGSTTDELRAAGAQRGVDAVSWRELVAAQFSGQGSFGNGAAMRVAPLGAYFASDLRRVVAQARLSATVTHTHPEAVAGAIAVAVAAALAWQYRARQTRPTRSEFIEQVMPFVPESDVRSHLRLARDIAPNTSAPAAASMLGSGYRISAQDTVPFVLWCAGQFLDNYEEALWQTSSGLGDVDTTCAMVGGIVVLYTGVEGIPDTWLEKREPLPAWALR
jgi:ADP-ribosylglycohydrolase